MRNTNNTIESAALNALLDSPSNQAANALLDGIMDEPVVGPLPAGIHTITVEKIKPVATAKGAMLIMEVRDAAAKPHNITLWVGATQEEKSMFETTKYYLLSQAECNTLNELLQKKPEIQVLGIPSTKDPRYTNYSFSKKFIEEFQG